MDEARVKMNRKDSGTLFNENNFRKKRTKDITSSSKQSASTEPISISMTKPETNSQTELAEVSTDEAYAVQNKEEFSLLMDARERMKEHAGVYTQDWEQGWKEETDLTSVHSQPYISNTLSRTKGKKRRSKHNGRVPFLLWLRTVMTVLGAVGIGMLFGWLVLSVFEQDWGLSENLPVQSNSSVNTDTEVPPLHPDSPAATDQQKETSNTTAVLPALSFYMIQGGVFSDQASAKTFQSSIRENGGAAGIFNGESIPVFLGIAEQRESAMHLSQFYKETGTETYIKEWSTRSSQWQVGTENISEAASGFGQAVKQFIARTAEMSALGISSGSSEVENWNEIQKAHQTALNQGRILLEAVPASSQEDGKQMVEQLTAILTAVDQYQKNPSESYLIEAQQSILGFLSAYDTWAAQIS